MDETQRKSQVMTRSGKTDEKTGIDFENRMMAGWKTVIHRHVQYEIG